jgi:hypothetical protein
VKEIGIRVLATAVVVGLFASSQSFAEIKLLAVGSLNESRAGAYADLSGLTYKLENGVPANVLGGLGSGLAYASGNTFLALPDRGPNAVPYDSSIDDTTSYIDRFHTITMDLDANTSGTGLPFTLAPRLRVTTLLWSLTPLVYGNGSGTSLGSGAPRYNNFLVHFFTGRSDNFNPNRDSGFPAAGRFDPESIRVSNDGLSIFISDEYGPYIYQFSRLTGARVRSFTLPSYFYVPNLSSIGNNEISGNTIGRTANKGMEGLAITPDGRTLVGIMQNALIQDANAGASKLLRIVTVDIASGATQQFAYLLTTGSGVSDIVALNDHEFLVDERDGKGRGDGSNAKVKQLFKIDLAGAMDISAMDGTLASTYAVPKTLFFDLVKSLTANGFAAGEIPAKIEGVALGPDVQVDGSPVHTLWIANDNDFLATVPDANGVQIPNPNQFFVFGFTDADLAGSTFVQQKFRGFRF